MFHDMRAKNVAIRYFRAWSSVPWMPIVPGTVESLSTFGKRDAHPKTAFWYRKQMDTVGEVVSGGQGGEARGAGGGARGRAEPGGETLDVDRGRGGDVLQVRPGEPAVARPAQPEGAHALRDGALDSGPPGVGAPALLRREPPSGALERLVLRPGVQPQVPRLP